MRILVLNGVNLDVLGRRDPEQYGDLSYSELGRRVGVTAQSMQATLAQLEERRAVERLTPGGRGRVARLRVTAEGDALRHAALAAVDEVERELLAELPAPQREQLTTLLFRLFTTEITGR